VIIHSIVNHTLNNAVVIGILIVSTSERHWRIISCDHVDVCDTVVVWLEVTVRAHPSGNHNRPPQHTDRVLEFQKFSIASSSSMLSKGAAMIVLLEGTSIVKSSPNRLARNPLDACNSRCYIHRYILKPTLPEISDFK
jgi:hypothetical protein